MGKVSWCAGLVCTALVSAGGDFSIADFGAKTDGSKCTEAIARTIAACAAAGGGRVVVPAGKWFTGAIRLKSDVELHLADGAEIVFSQDPEDYLPTVFTSWEGMECWSYSPLIYAFGCTNVAITGKGLLRGYEGEWKDSFWYRWVPSSGPVFKSRHQLYMWGATDEPVANRDVLKALGNPELRPHFIQFNRCRGIRLEDFRLRGSPFWTIHLYHSDDAVLRGLDVYAHGNNNDGVDIEMTRNVLVENCIFDQGDDGIVIKSGRNRDAWRLNRPTENVVVRKCVLRNSHTALTVGSELSGGARNILMEDCEVGTTYRVFYVKTNHRRGGRVENIRMRNVKAKEATVAAVCLETDVLYEWAKMPEFERRLTEIEGLFVDNLVCEKAKRRIYLKGYDGLHARNVRVNWLEVGEAAEPDVVENVDGFVEARKRPVNYDRSKIGPYALEDPLVFADGRKVTRENWPERRREILDIFAKGMYGEEPPKPEALVTELWDGKVGAVAGFGIRRQYRMWFRADKSGPCLNWIVWLPRHANGKVPVVSFLNYRGNHELVCDPDIPVMEAWSRNGKYVTGNRASEKTRGLMQDANQDTVLPLQTLLARGYAVMSACYCEVSPDPTHGEEDLAHFQDPFAYTGVFELWGRRDPTRTDNITSIGAWAWALSRGLDLAERIPEIDAKRAVVTGCSRLAKAAFLAAARDERFAVCAPVQTGGGGFPLAKRDFGESVSTESLYFTHWYCAAYAQHAADPAKTLGFDQHLLIAALAPRPLLILGYDSPWFDTEGEFLAAKAASPAWEVCGFPGLPDVAWPADFDTSAIGPRLGYVRRSEGHGISGFDWTWLLDFADGVLKGNL